MPTINLLGMNKDRQLALLERARRELAVGDDTLARQLLVSAAQQLAAKVRHNADEAISGLNKIRASVLQPTSCDGTDASSKTRSAP